MRKKSSPDEASPLIDKKSILNFFEDRARKVHDVGATRAVIYQDKNPDLAEQRDAHEKDRLFPLMKIGDGDRVLDAGCGTGRWAEVLLQKCKSYHGVDISPSLIKVAKSRFEGIRSANFSVCGLDQLSLKFLEVEEPFTRLISMGVLIYMNDDEAHNSLVKLEAMMDIKSRLIFREPIGIDFRLTLKDHYSEEMEQMYSAIYRTENELLQLFQDTLLDKGFEIIKVGDVFLDASLSNRAETKQKFFIFER